MGTIIDGKATATFIKEQIKKYVKPGTTLTIFQAGDNPASNVYIRNKQRACEEVGIQSNVIKVETPEEPHPHDEISVVWLKTCC